MLASPLNVAQAVTADVLPGAVEPRIGQNTSRINSKCCDGSLASKLVPLFTAKVLPPVDGNVLLTQNLEMDRNVQVLIDKNLDVNGTPMFRNLHLAGFWR